MKKIKGVSLVIVWMIVVSMLFSACGTSGKKSGNGEKMTITWQGIPYYAGTEKDSYPEKLLEEKFNIEIEPIFYDTEGYKTKKPLSMSQGKIPDIIYELDPIDVQTDASQGLLAEVPYETILKYAPSVVDEINKTAKQAWLYSYYEGKNFGVPNMYYGGKYGIVGKWRADWLEKLNITSVPTTLDEYHDALYKIAHNDPDGNGKNDTYGMSGDMKSYHYCFSEIFGAYGVTPFNWTEVDGEFVYGGLLPETKEALSTLAAWYADGLISPDFITDTTDNSIIEKFLSGKLGYMNSGATITQSQRELLQSVNPGAEVVAATLPKGPNGASGSFAWGQGGHIIAFGKQLENEPEKMQKILEIVEYLCKDQDFAAKVTTGEEHVHYEFADASVGGIVKKAPYDNSEQFTKHMACYGYGSNSFFCIFPINMETRNKFANNAELEVNKIYEQNNALTDAFLKPDVVPESGKYFENLRLKQMVYFSKIIRGEKPLDYYDEFINEWNTQGGDVLTKNANEMGTIRDEIFSKIGISE